MNPQATRWVSRATWSRTSAATACACYVLPWSAATEAALADVRDRVDALADRLRKLVSSPDAPALLAAHASRLLPPAKEEP